MCRFFAKIYIEYKIKQTFECYDVLHDIRTLQKDFRIVRKQHVRAPVSHEWFLKQHLC